MSSEAVEMVLEENEREEPDQSPVEVRPGFICKRGKEDVCRSWTAVLFKCRKGWMDLQE